MPFFNANPESSDLQLLPKALRSDEDLSAIAAECEADIIAYFTGEIATPRYPFTDTLHSTSIPSGAYALDAVNGVYVFLRGYDPVPASCAALLRAALVREIATLIPWRHARWRVNPITQTESAADGSKVLSYRDDKLQRFPPSFGMYLRPYDIRPPAIAI